jgi:PiT family inorganic phosphate transporter
MVPWRVAALLTSVFVILGAVLQGANGIETLGRLTPQNATNGTIEAFAAALTVAGMTWFRLPVSSSHAVVGAIVGIGLVQRNLAWAGLSKILICWLATPLGAMVLFFGVHKVLTILLRVWRPSLFTLDPVLRGGLLLCGCYAAYALGANNVASVAIVFVSAGNLSAPAAALLGGVAIAIGVVTFSKPVIFMVGEGIARLDSLSALSSVLSMALTVHLYALLGVPVSTSHAIVGAVIGLGLVHGLQVIRWRTLGRIGLAWVLTPILAGAAAIVLLLLNHLKYQP